MITMFISAWDGCKYLTLAFKPKLDNFARAQVSIEGNTCLFTGTVIEFNNVKAWKMAEVGGKPELRSR